MVRQPARLTLADLTSLPRTDFRLEHFCVEGWSAVAVRTGVLLAELARRAQVSPDARYVDFQSFDDDYHESWDIESALHPQTLIVYGQDGRLLDPAFGAPARVYSPVKLGYKCTKYLTRILFLAEPKRRLLERSGLRMVRRRVTPAAAFSLETCVPSLSSARDVVSGRRRSRVVDLADVAPPSPRKSQKSDKSLNQVANERVWTSQRYRHSRPHRSRRLVK